MTDHDIETFFATLKAANPAPASELHYASVFELLTAVLLSAQATDVGVNKATRTLFVAAPTPERMLALGTAGVEAHVRTIGLYRNKTKHPGDSIGTELLRYQARLCCPRLGALAEKSKWIPNRVRVNTITRST